MSAVPDTQNRQTATEYETQLPETAPAMLSSNSRSGRLSAQGTSKHQVSVSGHHTLNRSYTACCRSLAEESPDYDRAVENAERAIRARNDATPANLSMNTESPDLEPAPLLTSFSQTAASDARCPVQDNRGRQ